MINLCLMTTKFIFIFLILNHYSVCAHQETEKDVLSVIIKLEWVTEIIELDVRFKKISNEYILVLKEHSRKLKLTHEDIKKRKLACACGEPDSSIIDNSKIFHITEKETLDLINKLRKTIINSNTLITKYCAKNISSHYRFFGGNIFLGINTEPPINVKLLKTNNSNYENNNCDVVYTGQLLTKNGQPSLDLWVEILNNLSQYFSDSNEISDKFTLLRSDKQNRNILIFQDFFDSVL